MRRTLLAISAAAALLAGACGSSDHGATAHNVVSSTSVATLAPATTTTTSVPASTTTRAPTTTLPDTAVVPDKITVPYVDAVLAKLNHIYGNAVRSTVAAKKLTTQAVADIDSIYPASLATTERGIFREDARIALRDIQRHPGDQVTIVLHLISANPSCVFAKVRTTYKSVTVHQGPAPADEYLGLKRRAINSAAGLNTTPWEIFYDLTFGTPTRVSNQCGA